MRKKLFVSLLLTSLFCGHLSASTQGALRGTVKDKKGNPLEGVKITILSMSYSIVKFVVKSDKNGQFSRSAFSRTIIS